MESGVFGCSRQRESNKDRDMKDAINYTPRSRISWKFPFRNNFQGLFPSNRNVRWTLIAMPFASAESGRPSAPPAPLDASGPCKIELLIIRPLPVCIHRGVTMRSTHRERTRLLPFVVHFIPGAFDLFSCSPFCSLAMRPPAAVILMGDLSTVTEILHARADCPARGR